MYALILAALMVPEPLPMPELCSAPARFEIQVESRTPFTVYINGDRIEANETYQTENLEELVCVEIEIRYVCGGEVKSRKFFMDLEPGYKTIKTITISAMPLLAWC